MIIRDNSVNFASKHVVNPHLNCLVETVQMRVTSYGFYEKFLRKNIPELSSNTPSDLELWLL